jgi:preprotein translocase subunit SecE
VARDRQRAKQRKARRAGQNPGPEQTEPRRSNVPGELDHASGEADEFNAALVSGAGGRTVDDDDDADARAGDDTEPSADDDAERGADDERAARDRPDERAARDRPEDEVVADDDDAYDEEPDEDAPDDAELEREAVAAGGRRGRPAERDRPGAPTRSGPARFLAFLRASWAELQRVQWPDRRQVAQATAVVIGFVIIAGVYLGVADRIASEIVDLII